MFVEIIKEEGKPPIVVDRWIKKVRDDGFTPDEAMQVLKWSNFYGNIQTILKDFQLFDYFADIVESSVVGVRKPDPAIYQLGVDAMAYTAEQVLVVGDSFSKDMVPAKKVGCKAVWLKGEGWGGEVTDESLPDAIITDMVQLLPLV